MDRITKLQQAIIAVMDEYITDHAHSRSLKDLKYEKLMDLNNHHYQLIRVGWLDKQRIFNLIFHVDIIDDKIWIQEDSLEYSVAERLGDNGIGKKDIVLAYFSATHRQYTEYAVY
jgi:XisI protein